MEVKVEVYQAIEKTVRAGTNTSGRVYLPKEWVGKTVKIFLMEELDTKS
jgi:putative transposon-encoded protein